MHHAVHNHHAWGCRSTEDFRTQRESQPAHRGRVHLCLDGLPRCDVLPELRRQKRPPPTLQPWKGAQGRNPYAYEAGTVRPHPRAPRAWPGPSTRQVLSGHLLNELRF